MKLLTSSITLSLFLSIACYSQNLQAEIESTINDFTQSFLNEDYEKSLSYWNSSNDIVYIAGNKTYNTEQLHTLYKYLSENIESIEILEQSVKATPISPYRALCIWQGKEKVKMKDHEVVESNWISTLLMENKKGGWVILHCHTTHF
ncbi:nuclear transport factor 2 family protein [Carboxylicivirga sp. RSCT41]|uniref:nuclear transport factor 2 family protein n=1 Tax=Carboxylicivirga agarovorans TaxID=3417570 RepID=UPI003D34E03A